MREILNYLSKTYWKLDEKARSFVVDHCEELTIPKGEILLKEGEICRYVWFIKKGMLQAYQEGPAEDDKAVRIYTNWFMIQNDIATSVISFFRELPSLEEVIATEDSVVFRMSKEDLFAGIEQYSKLSMVTNAILIKYYCDAMLNGSCLRMKAPQFIYQHMLAVCPEILQRASQKDLASFLGVSDPVFREIKSGKYKQKPK